MKSKHVVLYLDKAHTGNRKLDHYIKKNKGQTLSFNQLDRLGVNVYFYLKNNHLATETVEFTVRLVFSDDYIPVMSFKISGYHQKDRRRLTIKCLLGVEERLRENYTSKSEHEQKIVNQDLESVFHSFLESEFLQDPKDHTYRLALWAEKKPKILRESLHSLNKKEQRQIKFFKQLLEREEVLLDVV